MMVIKTKLHRKAMQNYVYPDSKKCFQKSRVNYIKNVISGVLGWWDYGYSLSQFSTSFLTLFLLMETAIVTSANPPLYSIQVSVKNARVEL